VLLAVAAARRVPAAAALLGVAAGRTDKASAVGTVAVEAAERVATGAGRDLAEAARPLRSAPAEAASVPSA
jgi:hypothetical protein